MKLLTYAQLTTIASFTNKKNNVMKINYNNLIDRSITMYRNKIKTQFPCIFCNGGGYIKCRHCKNGCWKCQDSMLEECPFCNGGGKGRLWLSPLLI